MKKVLAWWNGLNIFQKRQISNMRCFIETTENLNFQEVAMFAAETTSDSESPSKENQAS